MLLKSTSSGRFVIEASEAELQLLNNALNEVCNGVQISDAEFSTRLGSSREDARRLLRSVTGALKAIGPAPA